jgi:hypothetical protein
MLQVLESLAQATALEGTVTVRTCTNARELVKTVCDWIDLKIDGHAPIKERVRVYCLRMDTVLQP